MKERVIPTQQGTDAPDLADPADLAAEVRRMRAQLERERKARRADAERDRRVVVLARELRRHTDRDTMLARAAAALGEEARVDRCQVHVLLPEAGGDGVGDWIRPGAELPPAVPLAALPASFFELAGDLAAAREGLLVADLLADKRFPVPDARAIVETLGIRSGLGVPICVGEQAVGWLLLMSVGPHAWARTDLTAYEGIADDLATTLIALQAYQRQRESTERLQQLDEEKNAFIANVSHELRSPLTSISGYLELLADGGMGELSAEQQHGVQIAGRNAQRLQRLVEDLLSLASYDAREARLEVTGVDLEEVIAECLTDLAPALAGRRLHVVVEGAGAPLVVLGDRLQLERVAANLLGNAVKFTHDGGTVTVRLEARATQARMTVSDTGIGIPADEQDRAFARFFRSSLSVAGEIPGTGLGLALCRTIVRQHGGTMSLRSTEGIGTEVEVELRMAPPV